MPVKRGLLKHSGLQLAIWANAKFHWFERVYGTTN